MEDIQNKVRDLMGILVDVNLYQKENKNILEISGLLSLPHQL